MPQAYKYIVTILCCLFNYVDSRLLSFIFETRANPGVQSMMSCSCICGAQLRYKTRGRLRPQICVILYFVCIKWIYPIWVYRKYTHLGYILPNGLYSPNGILLNWWDDNEIIIMIFRHDHECLELEEDIYSFESNWSSIWGAIINKLTLRWYFSKLWF